MTNLIKKLLQDKDWFKDIFDYALLTQQDVLFKEITDFCEDQSTFCEVKEHFAQSAPRITGKVLVAPTAKIFPGVFIEGPAVIGANAKIGPNTYLRGPVFIGEDCELGANVEIKCSVILKKSILRHLIYIGNSIVGNNCNIGAHFITAVSRMDKRTVSFRNCGDVLPIGKKAGCILGDNVETGISVSTMPGTIVTPNRLLFPYERLNGNRNENQE